MVVNMKLSLRWVSFRWILARTTHHAKKCSRMHRVCILRNGGLDDRCWCTGRRHLRFDSLDSDNLTTCFEIRYLESLGLPFGEQFVKSKRCQMQHRHFDGILIACIVRVILFHFGIFTFDFWWNRCVQIQRGLGHLDHLLNHQIT